MTPRHAEVLAYYRERIVRGGFTPTMTDAARQFGITPMRISAILRSLEEEGYVVIHPGKPQRIELAGVVSLVGVSSDELRAELARRGELLDGLDGGERLRLGGTRSYGAGTGSCAAPGCQLEVRRGHLMCLSHWRALPEALRRGILNAHSFARHSRRREDENRYGELVTLARDLLDRRSADAFGERG